MKANPKMKPSGLSWAPEVPSHWTVKKLGFVAALQSGEAITADEITETGEYAVYGGNGLRGYTDRFTHSGHYVLIGRQGALCGNVNYAEGKFWASEHAIVVTPREQLDVFWFGELLRAMDLNQYSVSAAQPGLAVETISALRIPVPPFREQQAIANYLRRQTVGIDSLAAEKEHLLKHLLKILLEKRCSLISRAVTRGINQAPSLRDSGIAWLRQIPAAWRAERSKWLFKERDERTQDEDGELLTVSHLTGVTPRSEKNVNMFEAETTEGYKICRKGDLVINTLWAWMGAMGISPCDGIVSPAYNVYVPGPELVGGYVDALVRTRQFAEEVIRYSKGVWSSRLRLYPEGFFEAWLPVPPLEEQHTIVAHIAQETAKLDTLRKAAGETLALLEERRAALITAAVTGTISVN